MEYKQIIARQKAAENRIIKTYGDPRKQSGIYIFSRVNAENKYCVYVGQAKNLRQRIAQHLLERDHIALSLKTHGLFDKESNASGWQCEWFCEDVEKLDERERSLISAYATAGFKLYNITSGGQGKGKSDINPRAERKGYVKGKQKGYMKAYAEIGELVAKYTSGLLSKGGKTADRKTEELKNKLGVKNQ